MRKLTLVPLLLVLFMCVTAFRCGRCEPPNCEIVTECDRDGTCRTVRRHRFFTGHSPTTASEMSENVGILDLANPWQPDMNGVTQMTIKIVDSSGQNSIQTFSLSPAPADIAANIPRYDNETTPYAFVFDDPAAVSNFVNTAPTAENSEWDEIMTFDFAITQVDCIAKSGRYINHFRQKDSSGITYDKSYTIVYRSPRGEYYGECNQGTITLEQ